MIESCFGFPAIVEHFFKVQVFFDRRQPPWKPVFLRSCAAALMGSFTKAKISPHCWHLRAFVISMVRSE